MTQNKEYDEQSVYRHVVAVEKAAGAIRTVLDRRLADNTLLHPLAYTRDILRALLKGSSVFTDIGLESRYARGCIAEIMLERIGETWMRDFNINGEVVSNVMLKVFPRTPSRTETTQIDTIFITKKAVFVCECKSYSGDKTTDGECIKSKDNSIYPWKQNSGHISAVLNNIGYTMPNVGLPEVFNIVYVFAEGCFKEWKAPKDDHEVLLVNYGALHTLNKLYNIASHEVLSDSDVQRIGEYFRAKIPSVEEQAEHIMRLEKMI